MNTADSGQWRHTSPLAILYFFGKVVRLVVQNGWQSLAPIAGLAVIGDYSLVELAYIGGGGGFLIIATGSVLSYWFFRYQLNDDSILIRQGVIKKSQLDIKFDRIQGINTRQNIVFRWFGLVTVSFDTAGSAGDEGSLPAVTQSLADHLRSKLNRRRAKAEADHETETAAEPLLRLGWRDVVRIGLADRRVYVVLAALGPLYERIGENFYELIGRRAESFVIETIGISVTASISAIVFLILAVVIVLSTISIFIAFLRYHNFELLLDDKTLRSVGGLLTRHEMSMELGKIQTLRLQQGLILRSFRRFQMTARQARAGQRQGRDKNFSIPLVTGKQANILRRRLLGDEGRGLLQLPRSSKFRAVSPWIMRVPFLINVLLPVIFAASVFFAFDDRAGFIVLVWPPIAMTASYLTWRRAAYHVTTDGLVRRSGMIGYRTVALLFRKVQRVTITQSLFQRRRGLATLRVFMASGAVKVPYIDHDAAKQLRDYILYKVESSQQAWH